MIGDRSYMQNFGRNYGGKSATLVLVLINAAVFLLEGALTFWTTKGADAPVTRFVNEYLALGPAGLQHGFVWQLITYQFLHGGLVHLLFNMLALWVFGRHLEDLMGRAEFLRLYFLSGVVGGLVQVLLSAVSKTHFGATVIGASAATCGLLAAFAMIEPHRRLTIALFLLLPISFPAIALFWIGLFMAVVGVLIPSDGVANGAHLGGLLFGVLFVHKIWRSGFDWDRLNPMAWANRVKPAAPSRRATVSKIVPLPVKPASKPESGVDFMSKEIDPILDKISAHGIQSLTERERKILEAARSRMAKR